MFPSEQSASYLPHSRPRGAEGQADGELGGLRSESRGRHVRVCEQQGKHPSRRARRNAPRARDVCCWCRVMSSHPPAVLRPGGVLPPSGGEDLQDPEGAGGEEEDAAPKAGHDARPALPSHVWPPTGSAWHGPAPGAPRATRTASQ